MPTYVSLLKFTRQGITNIKDSPSRLDSARKAFQSNGAQLKQFYLLMGEYDALVIIDAPNDEVFGKLILMTGSLGNVSTQSMRAFTEEEYRKLIASMP